MRKKTDVFNDREKISYFLKPEKEKTTKWFMKAFYVLAPVPVFLIFELLVKKESVAAAATAMTVLCIMAAVVMYCRAVFKSYHSLIYCDDEYYAEVQGMQDWKLVIMKLLISVVWLTAFVLVVILLFFMHFKLLEGMPASALDNELISTSTGFVGETFGEGIYLTFSVVSIFLQSITLISIAHMAASASHLKFCIRYKTLAGIFVFVAMYFFESDFVTLIKRMLIGFCGGIENVMMLDTAEYMHILMIIEAVSYVLLIALNVVITCYLMNKKYKE